MHADFGLSRVQAAVYVQQLITIVNGWQEFFKEMGVADSDIEEVSTFNDAQELIDQRNHFDLLQYPEQSARSGRRNAGAAAFRSSHSGN